MDDNDLLAKISAAFDALHAQDPVSELVNGEPRPRALIEAERLSHWVERLDPHATIELKIAARCQHLERWTIPRSSYPDGRAGYHAWRRALLEFHAGRASEVLAELGVSSAVRERVRRINLKLALGVDPEVGLMEDALCLSFLEHEAAEFAAQHEPSKVVHILRKTWGKMSERGRAEALALNVSPELRVLLERARTETSN